MKRGEKGFTLLELLIALGIMGIIMWPLTMATITLLTTPRRTADQGVVLQQVRNAGYWILRDVQMARSVNSTVPNCFLTLGIPRDTEESHDYSIVYLFDESKLKRQFYDSGGNLTSETFIADYIDTDNTMFKKLDTGLYKLTIRAAKGQAAVTRGYEVSQRLSSS